VVLAQLPAASVRPRSPLPRWLDFLDQVFEGDAERIRALAQWFGYNLTGDIAQQKFALFVGPPRSGKGTTMTVLSHLLGLANVASPTLTSLGSRFGLAPLVGKQAAIIGDAHLGRSSDAVAILERLKSIVGGDAQNVDRKGRDELAHVVLKARFTVSVNELPRLPDASAALRSRMLVIPFEVSFEGKEDHDLLGRLLAEIPGITNWALEGLGDLRRSGRFVQPQAGRVVIDDFVRLSSPSKSFVEDCCEIGSGRSTLASHLQCAWQEWCREHGHESGSVASFGAKLRAAVPGVSRVRQRHEGTLTYVYDGVALNGATMSKVQDRLLCRVD
jgi:putative DNA primase/helicase